MFLQHGADPNGKSDCSPRTVWQKALRIELLDPSSWVTLLMMLVQHGADVNAYLEENLSSGRVRRSALRYIKSRLGSILCLKDMDSTERDRLLVWFNLPGLFRRTYEDYVLPSVDELCRLRRIYVELIQLLTAKGAREEEWQETEAGTWTKVFPETTCLDREDQHTAGGGNLQNAEPASAQERRSPLTRIRDRMHRLLSRTY
jgi:hypothetical protein